MALQAEGEAQVSQRQARKDIAEAVGEHAQTRTPYGTVVKMLDLAPGVRMPYICPFALLFHLCSLSQSFAELCRSSLRGNVGRLVLYIDEIRPGNVLRPDKGRSTQCIYWTLTCFPEWFRTRELGWFTAMCLRSSVLEQVPGHTSGLLRTLLGVWYATSGDNLADPGVAAPCGPEFFAFRAEFAGFLGDEKALKEIWHVKGASGTKPCLMCKNVMQQRGDPVPDAYVRTLSCGRLEELDLHSDSSIFECADMLAAQAQAGTQSAKDRKVLQQALGMNFEPHGLLYSGALRTILRPATGTYWDWMHCLMSGGVVPVEVYALLCSMRGEGLSLTELDSFASEFVVPKGRNKLARNYFQQRVRDSADDGVLKSFASELFFVVEVLWQFCVLVLTPAGKLPRHVRAFELLRRIVRLCSMGDAVLTRLAELRAVICEHHELFVELYPTRVRPKLHYLLHLPDVFRSLQANLSCFVTERKHRAVKEIAASVFRHYEQSVTSTLVNASISQLLERRLQVPRGQLEGGRRFDEALEVFSGIVDGAEHVWAGTRATYSCCGPVCKGAHAPLGIVSDIFVCCPVTVRVRSLVPQALFPTQLLCHP